MKIYTSMKSISVSHNIDKEELSKENDWQFDNDVSDISTRKIIGTQDLLGHRFWLAAPKIWAQIRPWSVPRWRQQRSIRASKMQQGPTTSSTNHNTTNNNITNDKDNNNNNHLNNNNYSISHGPANNIDDSSHNNNIKNKNTKSNRSQCQLESNGRVVIRTVEYI